MRDQMNDMFLINFKNSNKIKREVYNKMINNTILKAIMMMELNNI